jgi:hypothetical protein
MILKITPSNLPAYIPPYLNSLRYTSTIENDFSQISNMDLFCEELGTVANQIHDLLNDDGTCAVLIGDVKRNKRVVPLGFRVMQLFEKKFPIKGYNNKNATQRFLY